MFNTRWTKAASTLFVRTVDTDVLVILKGLFHDMVASCPSAAIWIGLGMRKYFQYISLNSACAFLGPKTSRALPMFHSFTGCDTTSCFFGKIRKSAWEAWKSLPDVTEAFKFLENHHTTSCTWMIPSSSSWRDLRVLWFSTTRPAILFLSFIFILLASPTHCGPGTHKIEIKIKVKVDV